MDFVNICSRTIEKGPRKGELELFPDFRVSRSKDLMVRGKSFYAIWDEKVGLWSTDEYDVQRLIDEELNAEADRLEKEHGIRPTVKSLGSFGTNSWKQFRMFLQNISDSSHPLDDHLTFADTEVKKSDYVSKRLPYPLAPGDYNAWDEMIGTLYNVEERAKIEWAIGAVVAGDAKKIQKFLVLYGPAGTGKSTILNIIQDLFASYVTTFDAKALGSSSAAFATEVFKENPLVAIQHDGDLSKIEDNTKLNSIISHEDMPMNEKYKPGYTARVNAFLFMGTNQPVKISDAKSGIIRRLIDVVPTGVKLAANHYHALMSQIEFELGAIAHHCLEVYREMGKNYYNAYRPTEMMLQTDVFFNFIEAHFDVFKEQDGVTLRSAYSLYKEFCADTGIDKVLPQYKVREEMRNYFDEFKERGVIDGVDVRSVYVGFNADKFKTPVKDDIAYSLVLEEEVSLLDELLADMPAQYANDIETPSQTWAVVNTTLRDIDTSELHYVKVPENHIVIDFDLKDEQGNKSLEMNLMAASEWPPTYAELSKGGAGVHLHYLFDGKGVDASELDPNFSKGIEVKVYNGNASLRRRLSRCNNIDVAVMGMGRLPLKEKKMLSDNTIKSEKGLRDLIARNLRKEIHPGTKSSVDFIEKILDEAYRSGMTYDVTDMRGTIFAFANNSSNQALQSIKTVQRMKWRSEDADVSTDDPIHPDEPPSRQNGQDAFVKKEERLVFFDVEVYPNLFVICWKFEGSPQIMTMINPKPHEVEALFRMKLVGYNCRRYDNHILYAAYMGYTNQALYELSQKIIDNDRSGMFGEAYNLSYADIYDFTSLKQSLKKYQIQLGLPHVEMDIPWDQPVDPALWEKVAKYCGNDVETTEQTFVSRKQDFVARQILASLSGLSVNDPTPKHTARIIFGNNKAPQSEFVYTDLSTLFPGYVFNLGKSTYRDEDPSEGGYVFAEPGIWEKVAVLDVASMHPTSLINLNYFGDEYTPKFADLLYARIAIKRGKYDDARKMLDGKLAPYLGSVDDAKALSYALKIVINIVYGLTSAKFPNVFRDNRNVDNIVAKRGALFMIDLKHAVQEKGFTVVHIKTDSIKIPGATPEIIDFVMDFGRKYGYEFEHESTYDKFCLVNDAVYIAREDDHWEAVGAQFQHPYVFKKLFSGEEITFKDLCEVKQVTQGTMYLDFEHDRPAFMVEGLTFVGKFGQFVPVKDGFGGAKLWRVKDGKNYAVSGTKDYLWVEAEHAKSLPKDAINMDYFEELIDNAVGTIEKFGRFEEFV
jgi:hypothetical protein